MVGAVVRGAEAVWSHAIATTSDTQFRIGSLTKTFVAVLIMRLRDEGRLSLRDRIDKYLGTTEIGEQSIGQVLAHTSGLAAEPPGPWWERTAGDLRPTLGDVLGEQPVRHPPGERFHYASTGYAALGVLIENLRGKPWIQALREEVLTPLGMSRTSLLPESPFARGLAVHPYADMVLPETVEDVGIMGPAGQLWSTVDDLCQFASFLLGNGGRVLSPETLAEIRVPQVPPTDRQWGTSYGLGLQVRRAQGRVLSGHTGSMPGFVCALWVDPEEQLGSVVLANTTTGVPIGTLTSDLLHVVADREPRMPEPWRPASNIDTALLPLAGIWYWGPSAYVVRIQPGNALELAPISGSGGRSARFGRSENGTWIGRSGYFDSEILRVVKTEGEAISHLNVGSFIFTRHPYAPAAAIPGGVDAKGWRGSE